MLVYSSFFSAQSRRLLREHSDSNVDVVVDKGSRNSQNSFRLPAISSTPVLAMENEERKAVFVNPFETIKITINHANDLVRNADQKGVIQEGENRINKDR